MDVNEYLKKFDKFTKDPTLNAMKFLLSKFNNPQDKLKIIHVAGTNGKGSVCEMMNQILIQAGFKVGKFISPQLIKFNETIQINNTEITDSEISDILENLSTYIEEYNKENDIKVKWFEVITCIAIIYFERKNCDFVVLETGLGGTTDCTNIVNSIISIIVSVGYDHTDILGNSIEEIANHKAGIIKSNSDVIYLKQNDDDGEKVLKVLVNKCTEKNSVLHIMDKNDCVDYRYDHNFQYYSYKDMKDIAINLKGKKQIYNSTICIKAVEILREKGYKIENKYIRKALKNIIHKARFEKINDNPEIIYDGAHNKPAIENLVKTINQYYPNDKKIFIIAILNTKDYKKIIEILINNYKKSIFYFTDGVKEKKFISKEDLYNEAIKINNDGEYIKKSLSESIMEIKNKYKEEKIFIIGSFYIYKEVMKIIN